MAHVGINPAIYPCKSEDAASPGVDQETIDGRFDALGMPVDDEFIAALTRQAAG
jgi:hypothetical protein